MTQADLQNLIAQLPMVPFLPNGIPDGSDSGMMERPIHNIWDGKGNIVPWAYSCVDGFLTSKYRYGTRRITREDLNSMMYIGYNQLRQSVLGMKPSYSPNAVKYSTGYDNQYFVETSDENTKLSYVAPWGATSDYADRICTQEDKVWMRKDSMDAIVDFTGGEWDDSIGDLEWELSDDSPYWADIANRQTEKEGDVRVCSVTMKRDLYGWIYPLVGTISLCENQDPTSLDPVLYTPEQIAAQEAQHARLYSTGWRVLDDGGIGEVTLAQFSTVLYWKWGADSTYNTPVRKLFQSPQTAPMYFKKNRTYHFFARLSKMGFLRPSDAGSMPRAMLGGNARVQAQPIYSSLLSVSNNYWHSPYLPAKDVGYSADLDFSGGGPYRSKKSMAFEEFKTGIPRMAKPSLNID